MCNVNTDNRLHAVIKMWRRVLVWFAWTAAGVVSGQVQGQTSTGFLESIFTKEVMSIVTGGAGTGATVMGGSFGGMVLKLNTAIFVIAGLILCFALARRFIDTAQEGKFLGSRGDGAWYTFRTLYAVVLLAPTPVGICVGQVAVLWLAVQGCNIANGVFDLAKTAKVGEAMFSPKVLAPPAPTASSQKSAMELGVHKLAGVMRDTETRNLAITHQYTNEAERQAFNTARGDGLSSQFGYTSRWIDRLSYPVIEDDAAGKGINIQIKGGALADKREGVGLFVPWLVPDDVQAKREQRQAVMQVINSVYQIAMQYDGFNPFTLEPMTEERTKANQDAYLVALRKVTDTYIAAIDKILERERDATVARLQAAYDQGDYFSALREESSPSSSKVAASAKSNVKDWIGLGGVYLASHAAITDRQAAIKDSAWESFNTSLLGVISSPGSATIDMIKSGEIPFKEYFTSLLSVKELYKRVCKEQFDGILKAFTTTSGGNPMAHLQAVGHTTVDGISSMWMIISVINAFAAAIETLGETASNIAGGMAAILAGPIAALFAFIKSLTGSVMDVLRPLAMGAYVAGFGMSLYIPAVPFIIWMGVVISWLVVVAEAFIAVPAWAALHLLPDGDNISTQKTSAGYSYLLALLLRPSVNVIAFHVAAAIFVLAAGMVSAFFPMMRTTVDFDGLSSIVWLVGLLVLYFALQIMVVHKAFETTPLLADRMLRWIGADSPTINSEGRSAAIFASGANRLQTSRGPRGGSAPRSGASSKGSSNGKSGQSAEKKSSIQGAGAGQQAHPEQPSGGSRSGSAASSGSSGGGSGGGGGGSSGGSSGPAPSAQASSGSQSSRPSTQSSTGSSGTGSRKAGAGVQSGGHASPPDSTASSGLKGSVESIAGSGTGSPHSRSTAASIQSDRYSGQGLAGGSSGSNATASTTAGSSPVPRRAPPVQSAGDPTASSPDIHGAGGSNSAATAPGDSLQSAAVDTGAGNAARSTRAGTSSGTSADSGGKPATTPTSFNEIQSSGSSPDARPDSTPPKS